MMLVSSMKKHDNNISDTPILCEYCRCEYTTKTITNHYRRSHPEKYFTDGQERKEYKCSHCDEKYFSTQGREICYLDIVTYSNFLNFEKIE